MSAGALRRAAPLVGDGAETRRSHGGESFAAPRRSDGATTSAGEGKGAMTAHNVIGLGAEGPVKAIA